MRALLIALLCVLALPVRALEVGQPLPGLQIDSLGEMQIGSDDKLHFSAWDSGHLGGKTQVLLYMAARLSSKGMSEPFTDRLEAAGIPLERYHVTSVVNLDDALFGTRGFVLSELESKKRRYFRSSIVADDRGLGQKAWGLARKSSAIIILGVNREVLFFHEGAVSPAQIEAALQLIRDGGA